MNGFMLTLKNLGPMRLAAIGIVTIALLGFFTFLTSNMTSAPMALLYSDLDSSDAGAIVSRLEKMKVPYQASADGHSIKVPTDQVGRARMAIAAEGLPRGGSIGYEIFDQKEGFGTSSFVQNINHLRALEGELARTIGTLTPISTARVHLVLPQHELFSKTQTSATASVFLKMRGTATLTKEQIGAIQSLIAAAVPQLQPTQISIVDDRGNLLARPAPSDGTQAASASQDEQRQNFEMMQARKIEDLLSQSFGYGKVRAQVSAEMDFDRVTTQSEIYDPESQVVRSQQQTNEENKSTSSSSGDASIAANLPGGAPATGGEASGGSNNNRTELTTNYEINKTVRSQIRESGQIRRLSVAVVVDGTYKKGDDGKQIYVPRTTQELDSIKSLVRSAVNFDASRGDQLDVANMQFVQPEEAAGGLPPLDMLFGFPKEDLFRLIQTLILAVVGVLVLLLVVRPLLKRAMETGDALRSIEGGGAADNLLSAGGGGTAQLSSDGLGNLLGGSQEQSALDQMIDVSKVEGRVKSSSIKKVGELVDKHPEESVAILRNWMSQEGGR